MRLIHLIYFLTIICTVLNGHEDDDVMDRNNNVTEEVSKTTGQLVTGTSELPVEIDAGGNADNIEAEMNTDGSMKVKPVSTVMSVIPLAADVVPLLAVPHVFEAPSENESSESEGEIKLEVISEAFGNNSAIPDSDDDVNKLVPKEKVVIFEANGNQGASVEIESSEPMLPSVDMVDETTIGPKADVEVDPESQPELSPGPTSDIERITEFNPDATTKDTSLEEQADILHQSVELRPKMIPDKDNKPEADITMTTTEATTSRPKDTSTQATLSFLAFVISLTNYFL